jgi:hypothetical protein
MRATFDYFRRRYVAAYRQQHEVYRRALGRLAVDLEETRGRAQALARLNTLEGLGRPLAPEAVVALEALQEVRPCSRQDPPPDSLSPMCVCGFALGLEPRREWIDKAMRSVERALGQQMARLSGQVVRRILGRPSRGREGERLERFLQVVRASDVGGLVNVLDDALLDFLREMLGPPERVPGFLRAAPPPVEVTVPVLEQLARSFPIIGADQVDEAAAGFRRLLLDALEQARRASPGRDAVVRLAPPARAPARRRRGSAQS